MNSTKKYRTGGTTLVVEAEYYDFAPASCVCLGYFVSSYQQGRTYLRVWDNRMEINFPLAPFGCCTANELCVTDIISTVYFDRSPFRSGMICFCIPITCCGPPVIFVKKPAMACCDLSPYFGQTLMAAPCNVWGLRQYCIFGEPCYMQCAYPISGGLKDGEVFLGKMKGAVDSYAAKHNLGSSEMATFDIVSDNALGSIMDGKTKVAAAN